MRTSTLCNRAGIISIQIRKYRLFWIFISWASAVTVCCMRAEALITNSSRESTLARRDQKDASWFDSRENSEPSLCVKLCTCAMQWLWTCPELSLDSESGLYSSLACMECRHVERNGCTGTLLEVEHVRLKRYSEETASVLIWSDSGSARRVACESDGE